MKTFYFTNSLSVKADLSDLDSRKYPTSSPQKPGDQIAQGFSKDTTLQWNTEKQTLCAKPKSAPASSGPSASTGQLKRPAAVA